MTYAKGGMLPPRKDDADLIPATRCAGYLLSASEVRELGANGIGILAALNRKGRDDA